MAQHVRPACSPPPAKRRRALIGVSEEAGSRRSPLRCLTEESTIAHSAYAPSVVTRLVVDALDQANFLARPRNVRNVRRHRVAGFEEPADSPAAAVPDIARAASAPSEASTSTSFSFVRILVFPPLVRYPKDVLRMNQTQL